MSESEERLERPLFSAVGIEIEYMIVDLDSLSVLPIVDELLREVSGSERFEQEVERGRAAWSNELALHVIEMKTNGPAPSLAGLGALFQQEVEEINRRLRDRNACLLPTAMHPWMNPDREMRLWPHGDDVIYRTFHRIFDCRGHGWANLQSVHVNLPFAGDDEFGRLHAAIRMILPVLPALAASSPVIDGKPSSALDTRMEVYRYNARRVPSVSGQLIPEPVFTRGEYEGRLLEGIYRDLAPLDPMGVLRHEWVNARGAIARFDRSTIEIRVLDVQESPKADIAIAGATVAAVRSLVEEHHAGYPGQREWDTGRLADLLMLAVRDGSDAVIRDEAYLQCFGFPERSARAIELWQHLVEDVVIRDPGYPEWREALQLILDKGCLARRIRTALDRSPGRDGLQSTYRSLGQCLADGTLFALD